MKVRILRAIVSFIGLISILGITSNATPSGAQIPTTYTVTFFENASSTDSVSTYEAASAPQNLTLFSNLSPTFSNSGHTFAGWNTNPTGGGVSYSDGASYSFSADINLYAQWTSIPITHTVTFIENASSTDSVSTYEAASAPQNLTLFSNLSPTFSNSGHTFAGWNTNPTGGGVSYSDGASYSFSADINLYAIWSLLPTYQLSLDSNGGTGSLNSEWAYSGSSVVIPSSSSLTREGYTFEEWNSRADGSGRAYASGASILLSNNLTLFAIWQPNTYALQFDPQGGAAVSELTFTVGQSPLILPSSSKAGYQFSGWFTSPTGGSLVGTGGSATTPTQSQILYAQWTPIAVNVSFNLDGASGSLSQLSGPPGRSVVLPGASSMIRQGFVFIGWNASADGSGVSYAPGATYVLESSLTLFAQWKAVPTKVLYGAIGTFAPNSSTLSPQMKQAISRLAAVVTSRHYVSVSLYGFALAKEARASAQTLSLRRARVVAELLQSFLRARHDTKVRIAIAGEGAPSRNSSASLADVEVFVS